jgi:hypothetical protein
MSRRAFLNWTGAAMLSGAGGLFYCGAEAYRLRQKAQSIQLKTPQLKPIRILHVSDLHIGNRQQLEFAGRALLAGLAQPPDLICMTGDYINRKIYDPRACRALFSRLAAAAPVFACLGNHDGGQWAAGVGGDAATDRISALLTESGVTLLRNENRSITINGQPLTMIGLDDIWSGSMHINRAFQTLEKTAPAPRIVLAHNPDTKEQIKDHPWDLMLSGHTHGGQVCIPFLGAPVLPVKDRRYIHGLYPWNQRQLHISAGVGSSCGVRFNCPPEICHLVLTGPGIKTACAAENVSPAISSTEQPRKEATSRAM